MSHILVIKLSAFGDFILALGPMKAIREHHKESHITLLTTSPYVEFGRATGWFDEIWIDARPKIWQISKVLELRRKLRKGGFTHVYDLQTSDRSSFYFRLFNPKPEWSGVARGCSYPHANPQRGHMHTIERQAEQLAMAGIPKTPLPEVSWVQTDLARFDLPKNYILLVPGSALHRQTDKCWPADRYGLLADAMSKKGLTPVILGTKNEYQIAKVIAEHCTAVRSLIDETNFFDIVALARGARLAVGNDSGPMHLISIARCPSLVLYYKGSDPKLCGHRGYKVRYLHVPNLKNLSFERVEQEVKSLLND